MAVDNGWQMGLMTLLVLSHLVFIRLHLYSTSRDKKNAMNSNE